MTAVTILAHLLLLKLCSFCCSQSLNKVINDITNKKFISNFVGCTLIDICLEISFCCIINIKLENLFKYSEPDFGLFASTLFMVEAIASSVIMLLNPLMLWFYFKFKVVITCRKISILYPINFIAKKIVLATFSVVVFQCIWVKL